MRIRPDRAAARLWNEQGMRWLIVTVRITLPYVYMLIVFVLLRAAIFFGGGELRTVFYVLI